MYVAEATPCSHHSAYIITRACLQATIPTHRFFTMTERRADKLKLKRKKYVNEAHEAETKQHSMPAVNSRQSSTGSWLDEIELTSGEQLWKQVLISVSPDLQSVGWRAVPSLPDFTRQAGSKVEKPSAAELFSVGQESFQWFPFPSSRSCNAAQENPATGLGAENCQKSQMLAETISPTATIQSPQPPNTTENLESGLLAANSRENNQVCNKNSRQDLGVLLSLQNQTTKSFKEPLAVQKSGATSVKEPHVIQKSSTKCISVPRSTQKGSVLSARESQASKKGLKKIIQETHESQKCSTKNVREPSQQTFKLWSTVSSAKNNNTREEPRQVDLHGEELPECSNVEMEDNGEERASSSTSRLPEVQESVNKVVDVAGSLENCPICLMQFPKQFTQLDMDSHLAQCLSETTVDVVW
ncbi:Fanconi anemia core complex-associated protein 20 isoform X2 [Hyperolius riggenbachi]|uniref:Fanconi anemia core complex-associated protein 20 isoform X2 n=1 Tax=Hyperolius riggenbachi TaxID=752182 RepID=UPI0035A39337